MHNHYLATLSILLAFCLASFSACKQEKGEAESRAEKNVAIISGMYDSFKTGDIPAVLDKMANDIVWNEAEHFPYADGNPYIGPDAVLNGVFARLGDEWESFQITDQSIYPVGDHMVLATGRYTGTYKKTGNSLDAQHAHLWWLEDGKVTRFQQYTDTKQAWEVTRTEGDN